LLNRPGCQLATAVGSWLLTVLVKFAQTLEKLLRVLVRSLEMISENLRQEVTALTIALWSLKGVKGTYRQ
jgi:hypothetical protein